MGNTDKNGIASWKKVDVLTVLPGTVLKIQPCLHSARDILKSLWARSISLLACDTILFTVAVREFWVQANGMIYVSNFWCSRRKCLSRVTVEMCSNSKIVERFTFICLLTRIFHFLNSSNGNVLCSTWSLRWSFQEKVENSRFDGNYAWAESVFMKLKEVKAKKKAFQYKEHRCIDYQLMCCETRLNLVLLSTHIKIEHFSRNLKKCAGRLSILSWEITSFFAVSAFKGTYSRVKLPLPLLFH